MPLHRYTTPTYFGGLPGTHDLINVISGGVGASDGSALVSPQKPGPHPNAGTYFVAFGEDATSGNANRGFKALAENTDFLDDIVHADQSIPNVSAAVVPGAPVSSVVITGNIFVGNGGETNDQRTRSGLVAVLDGDGIPLHVLSGAVYVPVLVSKIHDGLSSSVLGSDYYTNPTVDFVPAIPASQAYRLVYYTRGNLKTQPTKAYTRLADGIRGEEDLWAYAKTTRLGTATFTGVKTFNDDVFFGPAADVQFDSTAVFNDEVTFNGVIQDSAEIEDDFSFGGTLVGLGTDYATPLLTTDSAGDDDGAEYKLLFSFKTSTVGVYARVYSKVSDPGLTITINARWVEATTEWFGDVTSEDAVKMAFSIGDPLKWESKAATLPGGGWLDNAWDQVVGAGSSLGSLFFAATLVNDFESATAPLLKTLALAEDNPGEPTNAWKLLFSFPTGGLAGDLEVRIYVGNFNTFAGIFAITINAAYNGQGAPCGEWSADDDTLPAYRFSWDGGSRSAIVHKATTTVAWTDSQWDLVGTTSLGAFAISGEYRYSGIKTRQILVPLVGSGTWSMSSGLLVSTGAAQVQFVKLDLPTGCTITRVEFLVTGNNLNVKLHKVTGPDFVGPGSPTASVPINLTAVGASLQVLDSGVVSLAVDRTTDLYTFELTSAASLQSIGSIRVTFSDVGLRNN